MRTSVQCGSTALGVVAVLVLGACNGDSMVGGQDPVAVPYVVVAQGSGTGNAAGAQFQLVQSQSELASYFYSVHPQNPAGPPVVDFGTNVTYFATLGSSPSTGYGISVEGLRKVSVGPMGALQIDIKTFKPGANCFNATVITAPYEIISFPREELGGGGVNVKVTEVVSDCSG